MLNLSITASCNRDCGYCFALDVLKTKTQSEMDVATFIRSLDLASQSGASEIRLLGGEPTIHRRFGDFLDIALERGLRVIVLTGGLIPSAALARIEATPPDRVGLLMNVVPPWEDEPRMKQRQEEVMARLGPRISLGLNIDGRGVEFGFLSDLIARHGLSKSVRLGLTHPIWKGQNASLKPKYYAAIGSRVAGFAASARREGIEINFDCGWVPCMFPEGALAELGIGPDQVGLRCNPILDVLVDGDVVSCYPLAHHARTDIASHETVQAMRSSFRDAQREDRRATIFAHCSTCSYFRAGDCTGGCMAASLIRRSEAPAAKPQTAGGGHAHA